MQQLQRRRQEHCWTDTRGRMDMRLQVQLHREGRILQSPKPHAAMCKVWSSEFGLPVPVLTLSGTSSPVQLSGQIPTEDLTYPRLIDSDSDSKVHYINTLSAVISAARSDFSRGRKYTGAYDCMTRMGTWQDAWVERKFIAAPK